MNIEYLMSLLLSFQFAVASESYNAKAEYSECPVTNYETCNGIETNETDITLYNRAGVQTVRVGFFVDDRTSVLVVDREVEKLNLLFEKSAVNIRVKPAFIQPIDIASYYGNDMRDVIYDMREWRTVYPFAEYESLVWNKGADFIHLFLDNNIDWNACGVAYTYDGTIAPGITACYSSLDVASWDPDQDISTEYIFAHELGHQFGLEHDEPNNRNFPLIASGHGLQVTPEYGTIMSYAKTRVPFYSNRKLQIKGEVYGNEYADAVQALNELAPTLARNFEDNNSANVLQTRHQPLSTFGDLPIPE